MLDQIIRFSIQNKLIIGIFTLALIIWGGWSLSRLPIDAVPDITNNQVQVITVSPSLAAPEVERLITFPVEVTMATIPGLVEIRSFSRFGLSVVTIVFTDATDVYWARQQVFERLQQAKSQIPPGVGQPELAPVTTGLGEIYQYTVHAKKGYESRYTATDLRTIQDWIVRRQLLGTKGVADVSSFGGYLKQYEIAVAPDRLRSQQVTVDQIFTALAANNQNTGGAYIDKRPNAYFIRSQGLIGNLDDIGKITVRTTGNGTPVRIRDVAQVRYGSAVRYGALTRNGEGEAVGAIVMMLKGANSSEVVRSVKKRMEQIRQTLPEGVEVTPFLDRTKLVNNAISTVSRNLIEGALIVIFVLVLLLGNLRAGLVVASVIPLSMLFAVSMMNLFGVSGNLMSLGAIDFGLIVDGAVIIVEATLHHMAGRGFTHRLTQAELDREVYVSASRIRSSAAFGEIIILIVYLPILALLGVEGKMFRPMAQTVAFAILGAFILSLTYVPMASALLLSKKPFHPRKTLSDRIIGFFHRLYHPAIRYVLRHKTVTVALSVALLAVSLWLFSSLGGEFIPQLDEGDFAIETRVLTGSSLSQTVDATLRAGKVLLTFPEVKEVVGKVGAGEIPTDPMPIEAADLMVILKDRSDWQTAGSREELAEKMTQALSEKVPGVSFGFQQPIQMRFNELMTGVKQDVALKIYGEDLDELTRQAGRIAALLPGVSGVKDLYVEKITGLPQIMVEYDRDRLAQYGISIQEANRTLNTAFAGGSAGLVYEGEKRYDLVVRLDSASRQDIESVRNLFITTVHGEQVPLGQVAAVSLRLGANQIQRDDTRRRITLAFNVRGRDVESTVEQIQGQIAAQIKLPPGYYITYGGQFQNLQQAKDRLSIAVPVALGLIFLLLFFTFRSVGQSLLIFTAIPLSAIGGVFALWLRGMPFSISAGVGFIALFGVAVLNGIVLIGEFNHLKKEGVADAGERVLQGTFIRLRPVLMTALVASLGFLPMALSHGSGAEVQKPLATVVIGGLVSATLLTLLVLPVLYVLAENTLGKPDSAEKPAENPATGQGSLTGLLALLLAGAWLLLAATPARAQTTTEQLLTQQTLTQQTLTEQQVVKLALENNLGIKADAFGIETQQNLRRAAVDLGRTDISWTRGQYNSILTDNNVTLTQTFPFPGTLVRQRQLAAAHLQSSRLRQDVRENKLTYQVKLAYEQARYAQAQRRLLLGQDTLVRDFLRAAQARLRTGEGTLLEQSTAESQVLETSTLLAQNQADSRIYQARLQTLLNTTGTIGVAEDSLTRRVWTAPADTVGQQDSSVLAQSPSLAFANQQRQIGDRSLRLEKSRWLPDVTVGYFNQSLRGTQLVSGQEQTFTGRDRFTGFQLGLALPLWFAPQSFRVRAAQSSLREADAQARLQARNLQGQYREALEQYHKFSQSLAFYEQSALRNAELLVRQGGQAFRAGNIGYVEYAQALTRALALRQTYLTVLSQYNQAVLTLEFLQGNQPVADGK